MCRLANIWVTADPQRIYLLATGSNIPVV